MHNPYKALKILTFSSLMI